MQVFDAFLKVRFQFGRFNGEDHNQTGCYWCYAIPWNATGSLVSFLVLDILRTLITLLVLDVLGLQRAPPKLARGCLHPLRRASLRQLVVFDVQMKLFFNMNSFFFFFFFQTPFSNIFDIQYSQRLVGFNIPISDSYDILWRSGDVQLYINSCQISKQYIKHFTMTITGGSHL